MMKRRTFLGTALSAIASNQQTKLQPPQNKKPLVLTPLETLVWPVVTSCSPVFDRFAGHTDTG